MEEDYKLTLPSEEDLIGEDKLEIFKKYGITAEPTDLSQTSSYFTQSPADHGWVLCVGKNGEFEEKWVDSTEAIRPMLKLSSKMYEEVLELAGNQDEVEFGEYPQDLTDIPTEKKLNISLENDILLKTGRTFTINNNELEEYYYNGKKYVCIDEEWFEVSPVKWLIDRKTKTLISKKCLLSEIDFNDELEYYGDFEETSIKRYLDNHMVKDLFQSIQKKEEIDEYSELTLLSEDDIWGPNKSNSLVAHGLQNYVTDFGKITGAKIYIPTNILIYRPEYERDYHIYINQLTRTAGNNGEVMAVSDHSKKKRYYDCKDTRSCGIRPVLRLTPKLFEKITKERQTHETMYGKYETVTYGEYPMYRVSDNEQWELLKAYKQGKMKKIEESYTVNGTAKNNESFIPETYEVYEYNNRKYIRYKKNTGIGDYTWIEVDQITWIVDDSTKTLISIPILLGGINFDNKEYYGNFNETEIKRFLDTHMKHDILQTTTEKKEKIIEKEESIQNKEIKDIIDNIYKLLELDIYNNKEEIKTTINKLLEEYNQNIEKSFNNKSILVIDNIDKKYLYSKLKSDLEDLLNKLKTKYEKYKEHISIIEFINKCINLLENDSIKPATDLEQDILTIKKNILPILKDNKKLEELKNIFITEKKDIKDYINNKRNSCNYKTLNDFIIGIRKKLQPYLLSVNKEIIEQDTIKEIQESYLELALGQKAKSKNEYIKYILEEIEKNIKIINTKGNKEEQDKLKNLLSIKKLDNDNLINSVSKISNLFIETYKIVLNIEKRELNNKEKEDYIIKR